MFSPDITSGKYVINRKTVFITARVKYLLKKPKQKIHAYRRLALVKPYDKQETENTSNMLYM